MEYVKRFCLALIALFLLAVHPAFAAEVDLSPLQRLIEETLNMVLQGLALAISGWIMYLVHKYVTPYIGAAREAQLQASLNTALQNGVSIAMTKFETTAKNYSKVEVHGMLAAWAAQYAVDHAPDAVRKFGLDPNQLALKALAYVPTAPSELGLSDPAPKVTAVTVAPLGDIVVTPDTGDAKNPEPGKDGAGHG